MSNRPLKILSVSGSDIPVPPLDYGGAERMQYEIIRGLAESGHQVTLLGAPGSKIPGKVIPYSLRSETKVDRGLARLRLWTNLWQLGEWADVIDWQCGGYTFMFPPFFFPR